MKKQKAEEGKEIKAKEVAEKKEVSDKTKETRLKLKELEAELVTLGMKKSEIKKLKESANDTVTDTER